MILTEEQAKQRLLNPGNLALNIGLSTSEKTNNKTSSMSLFGMGNRSEKINNSNNNVNKYPWQVSEPKVESKVESQVPAATTITTTPTFAEQLQFRLTTLEIPQDVVPVPKENTITTRSEDSAITIDDLVDNAESKLQISTAHSRALGVLNAALERLAIEVPNMKGDKIPAVITATTKVVETIRREKIETNKNKTGDSIQYHFYTPVQRKMSDYKVIEVEGKVIEEANP